MQGDATASLLPPTYPSTLSRNQGDNDLTKSSCQLKGLTPRQDITSLRALCTEHWLFLAKVYTTLKLCCRKNRFIFVFLWFSPEILATCSKTIVYFLLQVFSNSPAEGELQRGDVILAINGRDASTLTHKQAQDSIKFGGGQVELLVSR